MSLTCCFKVYTSSAPTCVGCFGSPLRPFLSVFLVFSSLLPLSPSPPLLLSASVRLRLRLPYPLPSVARGRISPPDFGSSGGFESHLAGKRYFWRIRPNLHRLFLSGGSCGILAGFESQSAKNSFFFSFFWLFWQLIKIK
jgi:hypothetical protein